jgi:cytochrome P450
MHTIDDIVNDIIDRRVAAPHLTRSDLLDLLLAARDETGEAMSRRQVRDELVTMILAGHDTTANGLSWLWHLLAANPDVRDRVVQEVGAVLGGRAPEAADIDELHWTRAAFEEAMRLYPPAWVLEREAVVDDELDRVRVPKGATVIFPVHLIHRDPRWWPDPEVFDPARFLPGAPTPQRGTYLPFGAGRRSCVGMNFALTEGTLIAAMLVQRYRFETDPTHAVTPSATVTLRPQHGLPMLVRSLHVSAP